MVRGLEPGPVICGLNRTGAGAAERCKDGLACRLARPPPSGESFCVKLEALRGRAVGLGAGGLRAGGFASCKRTLAIIPPSGTLIGGAPPETSEQEVRGMLATAQSVL